MCGPRRLKPAPSSASPTSAATFTGARSTATNRKSPSAAHSRGRADRPRVLHGAPPAGRGVSPIGGRKHGGLPPRLRRSGSLCLARRRSLRRLSRDPDAKPGNREAEGPFRRILVELFSAEGHSRAQRSEGAIARERSTSAWACSMARFRPRSWPRKMASRSFTTWRKGRRPAPSSTSARTTGRPGDMPPARCWTASATRAASR